MFYSNKDKSYHNHWFLWASEGEEKEKLYQDIRQLVEDMIKELLPPMIEAYVKSISIDVETRLNGKQTDLSGLRNDIERLIIAELSKIT